MTEKLKPCPLTDAEVKYVANRFLSWRLPENFHPDAGISFTPTFRTYGGGEMRHNPTGTNLFDADQAAQMVRHIVAGLPARPTDEAVIEKLVRSGPPAGRCGHFDTCPDFDDVGGGDEAMGLAIAGHALIVATDGMESLRPQRQAMLDAITALEAARKQG